MQKLRSGDLEGLGIIKRLHRVWRGKVLADVGSYGLGYLQGLPCKLKLVSKIRLCIPVLLLSWLLWQGWRVMHLVPGRQVQGQAGFYGVHELP